MYKIVSNFSSVFNLPKGSLKSVSKTIKLGIESSQVFTSVKTLRNPFSDSPFNYIVTFCLLFIAPSTMFSGRDEEEISLCNVRRVR